MNTFMKLLKLTLCLFILGSCNDEKMNIKETPENLKSIIINESIPLINLCDISFPKQKSNNLNFSNIPNNVYETKYEKYIKYGKKIYNALLKIDSSIKDIKFNNDAMFAELGVVCSFIASTSEMNRLKAIDGQKIASCGSAALGLDVIGGLINNTGKLMTEKSMKKIVKLIAKRYIGWVGVALATYSFVDCINN
jgi:hypothetical protein